MTFVAEATRETSATPERVFDTLVDHDAWASWTPASFRPMGRRLGILRSGSKPKVRIARGAPATIEVTVADRPREVTWCGGVPGLMRAEHRFMFDPLDGGGTRIRSVEQWSGPLARIMKRFIKPLAEKIGQEQVDSLARAAERG